MSEGSPRIRALIVDDEPPACMLLREYLAAHDDVDVVGECGNGFEAVKSIAELKPDVVFLDVQMPKLDGFEVLELLEPGPLVVFVTAYDEYALRAFEVNAVDYLLKPLSRERLAASLQRVRRFGDTAGAPAPGPAAAGSEAAAKLAAARHPAGGFLERVLVRAGSNVLIIPVDTIDLLEAQDDYVAIHTRGKVHLKTQPLSDLAAQRDPARFVRIHRSFVVNVAFVARIELAGREARSAVLRDGREVPVSRSGYARLRDHVGRGK